MLVLAASSGPGAVAMEPVGNEFPSCSSRMKSGLGKRVYMSSPSWPLRRRWSLPPADRPAPPSHATCFVLNQLMRHAEKDRHVQVMPAGVHHADILVLRILARTLLAYGKPWPR